MNNHAVYFSVLLALAVSLHTLSYALESNPETVKEKNIPKQVKSEKTEASGNMAANLNQKTKKVNNREINNASVNIGFKNSPVEFVKPKAKKVKTIPDNLVKTVKSGLSGFIPSKNYSEIVTEAKITGGRIDPFLSMKPPELEKIPEIPLKDQKFTNEPGTLNQEFSLSKTTKTEAKFKTKKPVKLAVKPETNLSKVTSAETQNENTEIIEAPKIQEGITLTGIITGSNPLALISVDNSNKVFGIGDLIRKNERIKIVSIDIDSGSVTISDEKNRKAKITIQ